MKRADIKVGMELYADHRQDWYQYPTGNRVVVVDAGRWRQQGGYGRQVVEDPTGVGVLVDMLNPTEDRVIESRKYMPIAHLRGPYADTVQHIQEVTDGRVERSRLAQQKLDADRKLANEVVDRCRTVGFTARPDYDIVGRVLINAADLAKLLDVYEAAAP